MYKLRQDIKYYRFINTYNNQIFKLDIDLYDNYLYKYSTNSNKIQIISTNNNSIEFILKEFDNFNDIVIRTELIDHCSDSIKMVIDTHIHIQTEQERYDILIENNETYLDILVSQYILDNKDFTNTKFFIYKNSIVSKHIYNNISEKKTNIKIDYVINDTIYLVIKNGSYKQICDIYKPFIDKSIDIDKKILSIKSRYSKGKLYLKISSIGYNSIEAILGTKSLIFKKGIDLNKIDTITETDIEAHIQINIIEELDVYINKTHHKIIVIDPDKFPNDLSWTNNSIKLNKICPTDCVLSINNELYTIKKGERYFEFPKKEKVMNIKLCVDSILLFESVINTGSDLPILSILSDPIRLVLNKKSLINAKIKLKNFKSTYIIESNKTQFIIPQKDLKQGINIINIESVENCIISNSNNSFYVCINNKGHI